MIDVAVSAVLLSILVVVAVGYGARVAISGPPHFARVERAGSSPLLGQSPMEMTYWALAPIGNALVRLGVSANSVTAISFVFGLTAGGALAAGHFGIAAALSAFSALADALDGYVARESGTASDAGETYDAAVDRYVEFFFFAGLLFYARGSALWVALILVALIGSFMVSYGTAKAEALHVDPPRGAMRRTERAAYLTLGVLVTPLAAPFLPPSLAGAPVALALAVVGVVSNVSAVHRLVKIAALTARRDATAAIEPRAEPKPAAERDALRASAGRATT